MPKQKAPKGAAIPSQNDVKDSRFSSFATDPRFRLPSKSHTRTKLDKRFSRMLQDEDFTRTAKVDRYGRKLDNDGKKEALQRLYEPEEDEDGESPEEKDVEVEDDDIIAKELQKADAKYDPARDGGFLSSSEDEDEDEEDEEEVAVRAEETFPDLQAEQDAVPMGEVTSSVAVVNLDWDNIGAVDLMAVFSSFLPTGGRIEKVSVYKSEFGKERLEREEMEGPPREIFNKPVKGEEEENLDSEDDSEDDEEADDDEDEKIKKDLLKADEGEEFDSAALRQYQLDRLRYYYAVIVFSDKDTAQKVYEATDGTEYLSSANFIDLRFVPDDTDFEDKPRDECKSIPMGYKPTEFVTDALQHSKVKLTWDAEDTSRKAVIQRAFGGSRAEIGENDLKAYLGSDSSEDEDEGPAIQDTEAPKLSRKEEAKRKMRAALGLSEEPMTTSKGVKESNVPVGDMEITFRSGLNTKEKGSVFENDPILEETTAEAYIRREKERKGRRKERAKARREDHDPDTAEVEDEVNKEEAQADLGFEDPFFATDDAVKKKASKSLRKEERLKRREAKATEEAAKESQRAELELLMADGTDAAKDRVGHFDMTEIARMEKAKKKAKHSKKGKETVEESKRGHMQEGFEMDVADPRFKAVFESHEYAIDPNNPKYSGTEGMKLLLEEGRKKRKIGDDMEESIIETGRQKERDAPGSSDLKGLLESVKKKAKR